MAPSESARLAARELARVWRDKPTVYRHWDEAERHYVDIASCQNSPITGVTAVGTLGLSDHDLDLGIVRVELVGAFPSSFAEAANVAATCAFNAFKDGLATKPDSIHPNVTKLYLPDTTLPHVMLVDPFLWDDGPLSLDIAGLKIAWLMMVPVSETERLYAAERGGDALTDRFEKAQIDIFDLRRAPVV